MRARAVQWADALHQWLGITEDRVHVVTGKHNQSLAGRRFEFLIVSYNMVRTALDRGYKPVCGH